MHASTASPRLLNELQMVANIVQSFVLCKNCFVKVVEAWTEKQNYSFDSRQAVSEKGKLLFIKFKIFWIDETCWFFLKIRMRYPGCFMVIDVCKKCNGGELPKTP